MHAFLIAVAAVLGAVVFGYCGRIMYLNHSGHCFPTGRSLSDDEKIRMVVQRSLIDRGPPPPFWPMRDREGRVVTSRGGRIVWVIEGGDVPVEPVPFESVEQFFALNPRCCELQSHYDDTEGRWTPGFLDRILGDAGGVVHATYRFRYLDQVGREAVSTYAYSEPVDNCGRPSGP